MSNKKSVQKAVPVTMMSHGGFDYDCATMTVDGQTLVVEISQDNPDEPVRQTSIYLHQNGLVNHLEIVTGNHPHIDSHRDAPNEFAYNKSSPAALQAIDDAIDRVFEDNKLTRSEARQLIQLSKDADAFAHHEIDAQTLIQKAAAVGYSSTPMPRKLAR